MVMMNDQVKPRYRCCVYDLEADQLRRNLQLQEIRSYGDSVKLEDGTVLHKKEYDKSLFAETNERSLCRCRKCGALFLMDYHYESDFYDPWSSEILYPVASEEEADLVNILMDGKGSGLPDFRSIYRYDWSYRWTGTEEPRPLDTEKLKEMIREKYAGVNRELLENLIRKAGQAHMVEKIPMPKPKPEPKKKKETTAEDYQYMADWECDPPTLIRLGSFEEMEADMFVYPGVWKDTPRLNDIRVGLGDCMRYDDISVKTAAGIMEKWRAYWDAPSDLCRQFIALHWYYSDCEDEEAGAEMDRIEQEELDIPDLRWLMKYSGNNPWKKRLRDRIRELEESGLEILE